MIERKTKGFNSCDPVATEPANAASHEENELSNYPVHPGEEYYYRVKAVGNSAESGYSNEVFIVVNNSNNPPQAPTSLKADEGYPSGVSLSWEDKSNNETKFIVWRQREGGTSVQVMEVPANDTYAWDQFTMQKEVKYTYRIQAVNAAGSSDFSNTATVVSASGSPAPPTNFTAAPVPSSTTSIKLTWKDNCANETQYQVLRKRRRDNITFDHAHRIPLGPDTTEMVDTGLEPGTRYDYIIEVHNSHSITYSNETSTCTYPRAPWVTATAVSSREVKLIWTNENPEPIKDYLINRRAEGGNWTQIAYGNQSLT